VRASFLLAALALGVGCGDARPCSSCPLVGGTYALTLGEFQGSSEACATLLPPPAPTSLTLLQSGSVLRATIGGESYSGTLLDTYDFSLLGAERQVDGGTEDLHVRGRFIPGAADSGTLRGSFDTTSRRGGRLCDGTQPFTGPRQ